jgi:hypothetical protein
LRLLRSFNEDEIQSRLDISNSNGKGKRGEVTDQFVELPLDQRIFDLIESEGSKGITTNEVYHKSSPLLVHTALCEFIIYFEEQFHVLLGEHHIIMLYPLKRATFYIHH